MTTKTALRALTVLAALCAAVLVTAGTASANPSDTPGMMPPTSPDSCNIDTSHWDAASQACVPGSGWEVGHGVYCPDGTIGHVTDTTGANDCVQPQDPSETEGRQIDCPTGGVGTQHADGTVTCPPAVTPAPSTRQDRVIEHGQPGVNRPLTSIPAPVAHSDAQSGPAAAAASPARAAASPDWQAVARLISAAVTRALAPFTR